MVLRWGILALLAASAAAETVMETEMKASLGQNVTLNCSIIEQNLWWHMEVHGRLRACIGRVMGGVFYLQNALPSAKYKSLKMNQLMVTDIQQEDYRLYFCGRRRDDNINFTDAFRIVPNDTVMPSSDDGQASEPRCIRRIWQNECFMYSSLALNGILLIIGLVCKCLRRMNCFKVNGSSSVLHENPETPEPPHEIVQFSSSSHFPTASSQDCIYSEAQLPQSMLPHH